MKLNIVKGIDEIFIDTGIIKRGDHKNLKVKEIFTGFLNASEVLSEANNNQDSELFKELLFGINILGFPFRYSETLAKLMNTFGNEMAMRELITGTLLIESKLPLLTDNINIYKNLSENFGIKIIDFKIF